ncbi:MAG: hypothetical protein Q9227_008609 [Pyrenula ochraceoflavens]
MVYNGKPSKACLHCRKRKLRCDLRPGSCGQCIRAHVECTGYRDVDQLRVQDESHAIQHRIRMSKPRTSQPPSKPSVSQQTDEPSTKSALIRPYKHPPSPPPSPLVLSLSLPLPDLALASFFHHYVSGFSKTYDVLEPLYLRSPPSLSSDPHLPASVEAVSLAFFSFHHSNPRALRIANERYATVALPLLNAALSASPESAASDSTLLSVLLLDLFEKITKSLPSASSCSLSPSPSGSESARTDADPWTSHVNGAVALLKLRGNQGASRFHDYASVRLAVRLSTNLLITCLASNAPVPTALIKLRRDLEPFLDTTDPKWRLSGLALKFCLLREAMHTTSGPSAVELVERAHDLDEEFVALAESMPAKFRPRRMNLDEHSERVLEGHFEIHEDHHITQVWNVLRAQRIMLMDMISTYKSFITSSQPSNGTVARSGTTSLTINTLAREICASIPQYLLPSLKEPSSRNICPPEKKMLQRYTLLYPLYVAGSYTSSSLPIRGWVLRQMRFMSDGLEIRNAGKIAQILDAAPETSPWAVYAMLGSYAFAA